MKTLIIHSLTEEAELIADLLTALDFEIVCNEGWARIVLSEKRPLS